jgi:putative ABC transport system permease protein
VTPSPSRAWTRIAWRELRGGLGGFWIYLMCLALGAWAIAAAGSITTSFSRGLDMQSRQLLGGDGAFNLSQRLATPEEMTWFRAHGTVTEAAALDMMGRAAGVTRQIDVRGVDALFPLVGEFELGPGDPPLHEAIAKKDGLWGVVATQSLLDQFRAKVGDRIRLGDTEVRIAARLVAEPDRLGKPGLMGPRAIVSIDFMKEQGLLSTGRLFRTTYRVALPPGAPDTLAADTKAEWGEEGPRYSGPRYRGKEDAVDGLRDLLDMINIFMSVVGIASLVAGGVGVAQATASFLDTRVESIAALKALGADAGTIRAAYALQLGALAALGSLIGVALGAASPWLLETLFGDRIPLSAVLGVYPLPLLKAFALGMLAAVMFASPALGRARATPPAALFRRMGDEGLARTPWLERLIALGGATGLVLLTVLGSGRPIMTLGLLFGAGFAYLVLVGAARIVKLLARLAGRGARGYWRLALANLGGPGSLAPTVAPARGLGLALKCLIATVQLNLLGQLRDTAPANAPSIVFRQIPVDQGEAFDAVIRQHGVDTTNLKDYRRAPLLLGRVVSIKGVPVGEAQVADSERWVTRGEQGMTYLADKPPELELTSGAWWPAGYSGPLLVSVEQGAARGMDLRVGDKIGFRFFGREVEAEVASTRVVDWSGFGASMAFIFSPGTLEAARPFSSAIVRLPPDKEDALVTAVADRWPDVLAFQLRRTLETAADLFEEVSLAVTALAGVVTVAGMLVLFGAFAAAARRRRRESALLKTFGASRAAVLALYAGEFALAGLAAAILGTAMGVAAAYPVVVNVFEAKWRFAWGPVLAVGGFAVISAALGGAMVGWATLSSRPARVLRSA